MSPVISICISHAECYWNLWDETNILLKVYLKDLFHGWPNPPDTFHLAVMIWTLIALCQKPTNLCHLTFIKIIKCFQDWYNPFLPMSPIFYIDSCVSQQQPPLSLIIFVPFSLLPSEIDCLGSYNHSSIFPYVSETYFRFNIELIFFYT